MSGRPIDMCFLRGILSGADNGRSTCTLSGVDISPFAESTIMATICGRALNLKRQRVAEYEGQDLTQGFFRQYQSVNSLLVARLQILSRQISSTQGHPNPILIFLALSAHMAIFMLCEVLETANSAAGLLETEIAGSKKRSLDAVSELSVLIQTLSQLNYFEVNSAQVLFLAFCPYK